VWKRARDFFVWLGRCVSVQYLCVWWDICRGRWGDKAWWRQWQQPLHQSQHGLLLKRWTSLWGLRYEQRQVVSQTRAERTIRMTSDVLIVIQTRRNQRRVCERLNRLRTHLLYTLDSVTMRLQNGPLSNGIKLHIFWNITKSQMILFIVFWSTEAVQWMKICNMNSKGYVLRIL